MEQSHKCFRVVLVVVIIGVLVSAVSADDWIDQMTAAASRAMQECHQNKAPTLSAVDCLKSKALLAMDRALQAGTDLRAAILTHYRPAMPFGNRK